MSPVLATGQYQPGPVLRFRNIPPKEIIGHCLLVYDLDELGPGEEMSRQELRVHLVEANDAVAALPLKIKLCGVLLDVIQRRRPVVAITGVHV